MRKYIVLGFALIATAAFAIDPPKPQTPLPAAPAAEEKPAPPPAAARPDIADSDKEAAAKADAAAQPEEDEKLPPLPGDVVPAGPPAARFNPTEKVRADFPVSFPIDI